MNRAQVSPLVPLCTYKCPGKRDQEAGSSCTVERKPTPVIPTGVEERRIGVLGTQREFSLRVFPHMQSRVRTKVRMVSSLKMIHVLCVT